MNVRSLLLASLLAAVCLFPLVGCTEPPAPTGPGPAPTTPDNNTTSPE